MNSMVYFYSKFTEEFLLLGAAGIFALLSVYCYHWVIQKRRMGLAHSQIPSAVVKSYLNQLINEAEFVRKQLFGMNNDGATAAMPFHGLNTGAAPVATTDPNKSAISPDLLARLGSLESQLREKESLVVNINVEKTKLLEEVETLRANSGGTAYIEANQKSLTDKIKNLEARLEEYSLFEEDLANLKRLQQENAQLKKKLSEAPAVAAPAPAPAPVAAEPAPAPQVTERKPLAAVPDVEPAPAPAPAPVAEAPKQKHALDQDAIDALLEGKPATPPVTPVAEPQPKLQAVAEAAPSADQFEKLVDSVETSLDAAPAAEPEPLKAVAGDPVPLPTNNEPSLANKTDEELLKEFENLLNS